MTSMNDPVWVKLSEHDLAERAGIMAAKLEHVRVLRRKKSDDAKSTQALIDTELDELGAMARVILEAEDEAKQGELFVDGTLSGISAGIAARCSCEGGLEADVKSPDCKLHGVEPETETEAEPAKCDGWHVGAKCADVECWLRAGEVKHEDGAEVAADYVVPVQVDVGTVEEPAAVADFREAKKRRRSREAST
jgi:hypothetical protein